MKGEVLKKHRKPTQQTRGKQSSPMYSISQTKHVHYMLYKNVLYISKEVCSPYVTMYLEILFLPISRNRYGFMERQKSLEMLRQDD